MIKLLKESDDKITAKSFQELISKLEDHGYSCEHYYDMKYPESNWLYITKNEDPYEAEFYRYDDGKYELYLHNIHPTRRRNESMKRRKQVKENFYRVWYNPYLLEPDEEDYVEVEADTDDDARRRVSSKGYVTSVEEIESLTNSYNKDVNCRKNYFKEDTDLYHDATKAVYDFFSRKGWDTNIPKVANYAEGVIELLELDPEFATGEYTMSDWYKDTQINYPEDIEWLDSTTY